ncbi:MAG: glycine betaine ABC transporter substrate-binding protein [Actinomycetota bacterium]
MRRSRTLVLGAAMLAMALVAVACSSGGDDTSGTPSGAAGGATIASQLTLGGPPECPDRPFCIPGLKDTYGLEFADFKPLDVGGPQTIAALQAGQIDVGLLFSTSSVIAENDWVVLEDDKQLQSAENIAPVVRTEVLNDEIAQILNSISAAVDSPTITGLNKLVEIDKQDPDAVAGDFLQQQGLLPSGGDGAGTELTVGVSGAFAENQIMAEMYGQALEAAGYTVNRQLDLGSREVSDKALQSGKIDIKPEYLSSELLFLDPSATASGDPDQVVEALTPLLETNGVTILDYAAANDQNSFVVTGDTADQYGLATMSDLAKPAP